MMRVLDDGCLILEGRTVLDSYLVTRKDGYGNRELSVEFTETDLEEIADLMDAVFEERFAGNDKFSSWTRRPIWREQLSEDLYRVNMRNSNDVPVLMADRSDCTEELGRGSVVTVKVFPKAFYANRDKINGVMLKLMAVRVDELVTGAEGHINATEGLFEEPIEGHTDVTYDPWNDPEIAEAAKAAIGRAEGLKAEVDAEKEAEADEVLRRMVDRATERSLNGRRY